MNKLYLTAQPHLFQGATKLSKNKNYFEGYYFKVNNDKEAIALIPGISLYGKKKKAFIQVITNENSYFINFPIEDFSYNHNPFYIKIKDNFFSLNNLHIDIKDRKQNLSIFGDIYYIDNTTIKRKLFSPNIMGPFTYFSCMECKHAIISMKSKATGLIKINEHKFEFKNNNGYMEKDYGISFPQNYLWCQANSFKNSKTALMLSIADIPFKSIRFKGFICSFLLNDKEYRFATYNKAKITKEKIANNSINITFTKGKYSLNIKAKTNKSKELFAPVIGKIQKSIYESINATVIITFKCENKIIYQDTSFSGGLEIVT